MIGVVMNVRVKSGMADKFAALTAKLQSDVRANEPGCRLFQVMQQNDDPLNFVFLEIFVDEAAHAAHPDMPYHREMSAAGWSCVDGQPTITQFTPLTS